MSARKLWEMTVLEWRRGYTPELELAKILPNIPFRLLLVTGLEIAGQDPVPFSSPSALGNMISWLVKTLSHLPLRLFLVVWLPGGQDPVQTLLFASGNKIGLAGLSWRLSRTFGGCLEPWVLSRSSKQNAVTNSPSDTTVPKSSHSRFLKHTLLANAWRSDNNANVDDGDDDDFEKNSTSYKN